MSTEPELTAGPGPLFADILALLQTVSETHPSEDVASEAVELHRRLLARPEDTSEATRYVVCLNHIERAMSIAKTIRRGDTYERKYKMDKGEGELNQAYAYIGARRPWRSSAHKLTRQRVERSE